MPLSFRYATDVPLRSDDILQALCVVQPQTGCSYEHGELILAKHHAQSTQLLLALSLNNIPTFSGNSCGNIRL